MNTEPPVLLSCRAKCANTFSALNGLLDAETAANERLQQQLEEAQTLIKLLHAWHWMPLVEKKSDAIADHPLWPTNNGRNVRPLWDHVEQLIQKWG